MRSRTRGRQETRMADQSVVSESIPEEERDFEEAYDQDDQSVTTEQEPPNSACSCCQRCCCCCRQRCNRHAQAIRASPTILLLPPLLVFGILVGAGVGGIIALAMREQRETVQQRATTLALETGAWFTNQIKQHTVLPLFTLAQFANQLQVFEGLPGDIGEPHLSESLPFSLEPQPRGISTHRNLTGSPCRDPNVTARYHSIASALKETSSLLPGVLVGLNLLPMGVLCLIHPLNNTLDYPDGVYLDSSFALGLDLIVDPDRKADAEASLVNYSNEIAVTGPLQLKECTLGRCDPSVREALIVRLAIPSEHHVITVDDQKYARWGFAEAVINFESLVRHSQMRETFQKHDQEFLLTRVETICSPIAGRYRAGDFCRDSRIPVIESPGFESRGKDAAQGWSTVTVDLDTTINAWKLTVAYRMDSIYPAWIAGASVAVVLLSLFLSVLLYWALFQRQSRSTMLVEIDRIETRIVELEEKRAFLEQELEQHRRSENDAGWSASSWESSIGNPGRVSARQVADYDEAVTTRREAAQDRVPPASAASLKKPSHRDPEVVPEVPPPCNDMEAHALGMNALAGW